MGLSRLSRVPTICFLFAAAAGFAPRSAAAMVITEVFYNPGAALGGDDLEFVEVYNDAPIVFDLSGSYFSKGIELVFPEGTFLKARTALAVCANAGKLKERFPEAENLIGDFTGRLDGSGEAIALVTPSGSPLAQVSYRDRGLWPAAADGTGFSLSLKSPRLDPLDPLNWVRSAQVGGTPGRENFPPPSIEGVEVFPETGPAAAWKYRKGYNEATMQPEDFSSPAGAWRQPAFDDALWPEGETPIGYGEEEIATPLADMEGHYVSFAARKRFRLTEAQLAEAVSASLSVRVDDGCAVFLNGEEVGRIGLPGAAGTEVPFDATAVSARELKSAKPFVISIPRAKVLSGENVLAVQVHNRRITETTGDAGFVAALSYQKTVIHAEVPAATVVINEVISRAPSAQRAVELFNTLAAPVDLGGYTISPDPERTASYKYPAGTVIAPRAFHAIAEASLGFPLGGPAISLYLFGPDGRTVVDAVALEDPDERPAAAQSHARHPDGSPTWWISTRPTPGSPNEIEVERDLVLNEIHYDPKLVLPTGQLDPAPERGELVEIFNRSARTIPLDGFRLASGFNYAFAPGASIAPGGYLVVARSPRYIRETYGLPAEQVLGPSDTASEGELKVFGTLKNGGERIRLEDPLGNTVDEVSYRDEGEWDELAGGGGSSLELIDPSQDNASPHAWGASDESAKAPWTEISLESKYVANLPPMPMESELHIFLLSEGEILIDGVSITQGDPPQELIPNGDFETNTVPWRLAGTHVRSFRTTDESKVGGASLHVVATGSGDNRVNRIEVDTAPALKAAPLKLKMWARWLRGSNAVHVSGYNNAFGATVWLPVPADTGSPGRENGLRARLRAETGSDNLGPVISRVSHAPAVPGSLEPIRVRATVTDADGVASVEVLHQKDGAATFDRAPLHDDGAHDDGEASDGVYSGEIPGYPLKTLVNFLIEAKDSGGRVRAYPRLAPEETLLLAVDDRIESTVSRYRLLVNAKNLNAPVTGLARRLLHSDELVRGSFVFEESEVYYNVGVRYHGSPWNRPPDPKMFRIRFNGDKPFTDGAKRINISRYGSVQNEGTSYQLLYKAQTQDAPVPQSQRYTYINMKLNTAPHGSGALADIRPVDGEYMSYNWPKDDGGQAWKVTGKLAFTDSGQMAGGGPDWTQLKAYSQGPYPGTQSPENYRFYFNPTVTLDEDSFDPLIRLLTVMDRTTTPDTGYDKAIAEVMNIESSLRVFAVRSLLADWDTVDIGNGQNAYLYYAPREGRHYLVPWDMDHTFERTDVAIGPGSGTNGFRRLINRPIYKRQYARILSELNETSWSDDYLTAWFKLVSETAGPGKVAAGTGLQAFIRQRRTMVATYVRSGVGVPFAISTPSPVGSTSDHVAIAGTAGIDVTSLFATVNAGDPQELNPVWSTPPRQTTAIPTLWQVEVAGLAPGRNDVDLLAFDREGNLVGSKSIEAYNGSGWEPPAITSVAPASGALDGGTAITIRGSGFRVKPAVDIGGKPAADVLLVSAGEITAVTPAATKEGPADVTVTNIDQQKGSLAGGFLYSPSSASFRRGDVDGSQGVNQSDALAILLYLFRAGAVACPDAADVNDDGKINVSDPIVLLLHLFQGGPAPPEPFVTPGSDPTPDALGCP